METGVVLCSGANVPSHRRYEKRLNIKNVKWIRVDTDPGIKPDIIGSFYELDTYQKLGFGQHSYVIQEHCPLATSLATWEIITVAASSLLRPGGIFIFPSLLQSITGALEEEIITGVAEWRMRPSQEAMLYEDELSREERKARRTKMVGREKEMKGKINVWKEYLEGGPIKATYHEVIQRLASIGGFSEVVEIVHNNQILLFTKL